MAAKPHTSRFGPLWIGTACVALGAAAGAGYWAYRSSLPPNAGGTAAAPTKNTARKPLTLIVSGDTAGWIVPCGCTSNQSGGLPRRGSLAADERRRAETVVVDAGGAPGGGSPYQKAKFEAILRGEMAMGLAVHNIGGAEAELGPDYLRGASRRLKVPLLSANVRDRQGNLVALPYRIVEAAGRRLAFAGVLSPQFQTAEILVSEPRQAILETLQSIQEPYDSLIVLAYLPEAELRELAAGLPEADVVMGGPTGQSISPTKVGPVLLASATNKGKFILTLSAPAEGDRPAWTGQAVEMTAKFAGEPRQLENVAAFREVLARRDFTSAESGLVSPLPDNLPADYRVAGSEKCRVCHVEEHRRWTESGHHHAWETLQKDQSHVDSYCQQCHTTGFGLPGGFASVRRSSRQTGVGCESCHGPSQAHVREPRTRTPWPAADQCIRCHDPENSPQFDYDSYWSQIEHGPDEKPDKEDES